MPKMDNSLVLTSTGVQNKQYQNILLGNIQKLWTSRQMLDITFQADGQEIQAHQLVLASASTDLCDALTQIQQTTKHAVLDLNRSGITMSGLKELLNYLYCGKMKLDAKLCQDVAKAAKTLHIPQVVALCALFRATFMPGTSTAENNPSSSPISPILKSVWKVEQPNTKETTKEDGRISPKPTTVLPKLKQEVYKADVSHTSSANVETDQSDSSGKKPSGLIGKPQTLISLDKSELYKELSNHKLNWMRDVTSQDTPAFPSATISKTKVLDADERKSVPVPTGLFARIKHSPGSASVLRAQRGGAIKVALPIVQDFSTVKVKEEPPDDFSDNTSSLSTDASYPRLEKRDDAGPKVPNPEIAKKVVTTGTDLQQKLDQKSPGTVPKPDECIIPPAEIKQEPMDFEDESSKKDAAFPVSCVRVASAITSAITSETEVSMDSNASFSDAASIPDSLPDNKGTETEEPKTVVMDVEAVQKELPSERSLTNAVNKSVGEVEAPWTAKTSGNQFFRFKRKRQRRGRTQYVNPRKIQAGEDMAEKKEPLKQDSPPKVKLVHVPLPTGAIVVKPFAITSNAKGGSTAVDSSAKMRKMLENEKAKSPPPAFPSASGDTQIQTYMHLMRPAAEKNPKPPEDNSQKNSPEPDVITSGVIKKTVPAPALASTSATCTSDHQEASTDARELETTFVRARGIKNFKSTYNPPISVRNFDAPNSKYRDNSNAQKEKEKPEDADGKKMIMLSSVVRNGCKGRFHISCILCHFLFSSVESCEKHILRKHFPGELIFADTEEGRAKLEEEQNTPEDKKVMYLCSCCGYVTQNQRFIYLHRFYQHEVPILQNMIEPYCEACELLLNNGTDMLAHEKMHRNHYICNTCYKRYICLDSLCHHVRKAHNILGNTELFIRQVTYD